MAGCQWATVYGQVASVLSTGRWWKLTVEEEGLYSVGTGEVPGLRGVSVDSIAVYGGSGAMLPIKNSEAPSGDLRQVRSEIVDRNGNGIFDTGDEVLFFGEGAGSWTFDESVMRWMHETHAYDKANYYFIGITGETPLRMAMAACSFSAAFLRPSSARAHSPMRDVKMLYSKASGLSPFT